MVHQRHQRGPVSPGVQQEDRLAVQPDLPPCQHFEKFVQRARTARQHHDCVRVHEHHLLALVHILGDHQRRQVTPPLFAHHQMGGDHAQRARPGPLGRSRHFAHQPDIARAIDQTPAFRRDQRTQGARLVRIGGIRAGA